MRQFLKVTSGIFQKPMIELFAKIINIFSSIAKIIFDSQDPSLDFGFQSMDRDYLIQQHCKRDVFSKFYPDFMHEVSNNLLMGTKKLLLNLIEYLS